MKISYFFIFILIISSTRSYSQACCSAGTPLSAQMGLEFLNKGDLLVSIAYDYNFLNDQFNYDEQLNSEERSRISQSIITRIQYAFADKWTLGISLPYVYRSESNNSPNSSFSSLSSSGIGDLLLQLNFTVLRKGRHNFLLSGGLKLPTGSNDERNEFGFPLPADLQPGTGSWDGIIGALYEMNNILGGDFHFNLSGTARFNGEGTRFDGKQTYKFGNAYQLITGLTYEILLKRSYLLPALNLSYRRTMIDITNDALTPSTGGDWLNLVPSLAYYLRGNAKFLFSTAIPLYRYLEGTQLTTTYRYYVQIQYTFKTRKNEILENF